MTLLHTSAEKMKATGKPVIVLYFGDYDNAGMEISTTVQKVLTGFGVDLDFRRIALTLEQIQGYQLPTREVKETGKKRADFIAKYGSDCVDLDALESVSSAVLPQLVEDAIKETIDPEAWSNEEQIEWTERRQLAAWVNNSA